MNVYGSKVGYSVSCFDFYIVYQLIFILYIFMLIIIQIKDN
jgi:hypothetical protein